MARVAKAPNARGKLRKPSWLREAREGQHGKPIAAFAGQSKAYERGTHSGPLHAFILPATGDPNGHLADIHGDVSVARGHEQSDKGGVWDGRVGKRRGGGPKHPGHASHHTLRGSGKNDALPGGNRNTRSRSWPSMPKHL